MDIVETKTLFFKEGSSDKFYTATIDEIEGEYRLSFVYGRRGASGQAGFGIAAVNEDGEVLTTEVIGDIPDGDVAAVDSMLRKKVAEESRGKSS